MPRYIDADKIIYSWVVDSDGEEHDGVTLQSIIRKMPTADVVERKVGNMTNADRIRSMTDEELAVWIVHKTEGNGFDGYEEHVKSWLDWLKQEATDAKVR